MKQIKIISGLLFTMLFSVLVGGSVGIPAVALFGGIVLFSAFSVMPKGAFLTAINTTELVAALGDYYRENRDILVSETLLDPNVNEMFTVYDDVTDELPMPNLGITDIIKPGVVKTFVPTSNALEFGARILKVRDVKFDLLLVPTDLHKKWLGYKRTNRRADGSHDPYEILFEAFILDYISKAARSQLYLNAMFKGVYNAAGTAPVSTMTGFASLVTAEIAAGNIVPVSIPNITAANVITSLEAVYDGLGEAYKAMPTQMKVEPSIFDWYNRQYRADYGPNNNYGGMDRLSLKLDGTLCDVVREPGLAGTGRVICSPLENFAYGCDTGATATLEIQKFDRSIKIMGDFKAGVQFAQIHDRALSVNELVSDGIV